MSRPLRSSSDVSGGYSRLERVVMEALASDLGAVAPDLAAQFAASRPRLRRNSGFGLFTEAATNPARPVASSASGDLGTVHAMVANLPDPVAFTARLQNGRFIGVMGDSYGQDTRAIDFGSVHFTDVFTLDASGRSIPFRSAVAPDPAPEPQRFKARPAAAPAPPQVRVARPENLKAIALTARQGSGALQAAMDDARRDARPAESAAAPEPVDKVTLIVGAWAALLVAAVLAVILFRINWIVAFAVVIWVGSWISKPKGLAALRRLVESWNAARDARRG